MTDETKLGEHFTPRSGDTHVIGTAEGVEDHATAVNVDQLAREAAAPAAGGEESASTAVATGFAVAQAPVELPEPEQPEADADHADS